LQPLDRISGDHWPDGVRLSDIEPRFACQACGQRGVDVRPNFHWEREALQMAVSAWGVNLKGGPDARSGFGNIVDNRDGFGSAVGSRPDV
jgi:hypothetical protein